MPQRVVNAVQVKLQSVLQGKTLQELLRASDGGPVYVPYLFSHWADPKGVEPELLSFAAITDDPEPQVAAAGLDRTIINITYRQTVGRCRQMNWAPAPPEMDRAAMQADSKNW